MESHFNYQGLDLKNITGPLELSVSVKKGTLKGEPKVRIRKRKNSEAPTEVPTDRGSVGYSLFTIDSKILKLEGGRISIDVPAQAELDGIVEINYQLSQGGRSLINQSISDSNVRAGQVKNYTTHINLGEEEKRTLAEGY